MTKENGPAPLSAGLSIVRVLIVLTLAAGLLWLSPHMGALLTP